MLSDTLLRHKEWLGDDLDLAPIRLAGGFICADTHLGCVGCQWCLNRRYPPQRRLLENGVHRDWSELGLTGARIAELIRGLPSYRRAKVPVRIGNITDLVFEEDGAREIVEGLDPDYPVMLASRYPAGEKTRRLVRERRNVMLYLSIAPPTRGFDAMSVDAMTVIESIENLPREQVFLMLCPLVAGSAEPVRSLLRRIPTGTSMGLKEMSVSGIPGAEPLVPMIPEEVRGLAHEARELGLRSMPYYGCRMRSNLRQSFFRAARVRALAPQVCDGCASHKACAPREPPGEEALRTEAARIGLTVGQVRVREDGGLEVGVAEAVSRADEVYLSELFRTEVTLSSLGRAAERQTVRVPETVLARWEATGFYPVEEMRRLARAMLPLV